MKKETAVTHPTLVRIEQEREVVKRDLAAGFIDREQYREKMFNLVDQFREAFDRGEIVLNTP